MPSFRRSLLSRLSRALRVDLESLDRRRERFLVTLSLGLLFIGLTAFPAVFTVLMITQAPNVIGFMSFWVTALISGVVTLLWVRRGWLRAASWVLVGAPAASVVLTLPWVPNSLTTSIFLSSLVLIACLSMSWREVVAFAVVLSVCAGVIIAQVDHPQGGPDADVIAALIPLILATAFITRLGMNTQRAVEGALEEARQEAMEANHTKSAFLANMSHELRTPLNAIIGYTELMQEEAQDLEFHEFDPDLARVVTSAKHLLTLLNDVLDLAKVEAGKMDIVASDVDVVAFVRDLRFSAESLARKNQNTFTLTCQLDEDKPTLTMCTDATKLRQILLNLLSNAAKFTTHGEIGLRVSAEAGMVHFVVYDTGVGMTPEQQARVFEEFVQAESTTHSTHGGTGLGLTLVRRLCVLLGGVVEVQSALGEGTSFCVVLPQNIQQVPKQIV